MNNKVLKIVLSIAFIALLLYCIWYVIITNTRSNDKFETETPVIMTIQQKAVATGKINPKERIEIKPNISGIIKEIYIKEGDEVKVGQLLATIKVVPVSKQDFESAETEYKIAKQNLNQAQKDYDIAKTGITSGLEDLASIQVRSTANGQALEVPVEVGDQVIEANTFNAGTTIASIADISKMIFEGKVDESDAGKMHEGMKLKIIIGALQDKDINGRLTFISPQGKEENGAVKYKIKADIIIPEGVSIRAGYSANAEVILSERKNILAIREALMQFDGEKPYLEVLQSDGKFKKVYVKLGLSDGIYVQVKGISKNDKLKIWNTSDQDKSERKK